MKKLLYLTLCMAFLLCGCSVQQAETDSERKPWPTHAPGATPYINLMPEEVSSMIEENRAYESYVDFLRSIYVEEGHFYFNDRELEMFRELPQDEPYSFTVHRLPDWTHDKRLPENSTPYSELQYKLFTEDATEKELSKLTELLSTMAETLGLYTEDYFRLREEVSFEYAVKSAKAFAFLDCDAQVRGMVSIENGVEVRYYIATVTTTPAHLFELSDQTEHLYFIEQLYEQVDENFSEVRWSSAEGIS